LKDLKHSAKLINGWSSTSSLGQMKTPVRFYRSPIIDHQRSTIPFGCMKTSSDSTNTWSLTIDDRWSSMDVWNFCQILSIPDHRPSTSFVGELWHLENLGKIYQSPTIDHWLWETSFVRTQLFAKLVDSTINHWRVHLVNFKPSTNLVDLTIDRQRNLSMKSNT